MRNQKTKKLQILEDRMRFLDIYHYPSIIISDENWEKIFSETFPDKKMVEDNFANIMKFKNDLYQGEVMTADINRYPVLIYTIGNYYIRGNNVFLSYSTKDSEYFKIPEISNRLEEHPKIDNVYFWEVDSGENIVTYMEKTLKMCKVFILFCTEKSIKSQAVEDEWQSAFQLRKKGMLKIIPVYENEEFVPVLLTPLLNVKFDTEDFEAFIEKLVEEILRK